MAQSPEIIFLIGPTAVGKTDVACLLAKKFNGEIVSCDSMQVYKEIHIASGKPSADFLRTVRHHLIGTVSVQDDFDVARFQRLAFDSIQNIAGRGCLPLVVGGSGLYMSVLLDGIFENELKDESLRLKFEALARQKGNAFLYEKLRCCDPQAAEKIHVNDRRRIIRALEVYELTGAPISVLQKTRKGLWGQYGIRIFGLNRPREELYERINRRVYEMFEQGLVQEVEDLLKKPLSPTASKIIGIKEVEQFLIGKLKLSEVKELMCRNTRRYAKRQLTWFRRDRRIEWLQVSQKMSPEEVADMILQRLEEA